MFVCVCIYIYEHILHNAVQSKVVDCFGHYILCCVMCTIRDKYEIYASI